MKLILFLLHFSYTFIYLQGYHKLLLLSHPVIVLIVKYLTKVRCSYTIISVQVNDNITHIEPEMCDLTKIVIPKIMNEWEYIAEALRYDLTTIRAIEEKGRGDPKMCCREFFKDWLTTNNGANAGPKVWSTLLGVLKEINEISADIVEAINKEVKQFYGYLAS